MTSNDEWAKKQAWEIWNGFNDQPSERAILAAIQEAIERGEKNAIARMEAPMTSNDEWVRERAAAVRGSAPWHDRSLVGPIEAALRDAIERGKAEQDKAVAAAEARGHMEGYEKGLTVADREIAEAVAAERERLLDRLREPDEEMIYSFYGVDAEDARRLLRALARTLTEGQETDT